MECFITQGRTLLNKIKKVAIIFIWILIWQMLYIYCGNDILLPSPIDVLKNLYFMLFKYEFWKSALLSTIRIMEGFLGAIIVGTILSVITYKFRILKELFLPMLNIVKATPVASFIILALVWIPSGEIPSFISFLMVLPIIWINVTQGILKVDKSLLEMANVFKINKIRMILKIYLPSVFPYFIAACTTGMGFAWKSGVAAEVIANTRLSIGSQIYRSKIYLETTDLFTWTLVVIFISVGLEILMKKVMKSLLLRYGFNEGDR